MDTAAIGAATVSRTCRGTSLTATRRMILFASFGVRRRTRLATTQSRLVHDCVCQ
jgi:hypothetical protein